MNGTLDFILKVYSFLLRLYPHSFKDDFKEQMLLDFADLVADTGKKGKLSLIFFLLRELLDLPANLLRMHMTEGRMFKILRLQFIDMGLRSAVGFGIVFALAIPIMMLAYEKMFRGLDPIVIALQVSFYDLFHVEQQFALISWLPSALSHLIVGLVFGVLLALLFGTRSTYSQYILVGTLGWFLRNSVNDTFSYFNFWVLLDESQYGYFSYMMQAFTGAISGLIFVFLESNRRSAARWLTASIMIYPLFVYVYLEQLFNLLVFRTPWRFVGVTSLIVILVASLFMVAFKLDDRRKSARLILAGTIGYPAIGVLISFAYRLVYLPVTSSGTIFSTIIDTFSIVVWNAIYGVLFGLFLGMILGFQKTNNSGPVVS